MKGITPEVISSREFFRSILLAQRVVATAQLRQDIFFTGILSEHPVWPLLLYTDDALWTSPIADRLPVAFHSVDGMNHIRCDIIKLKDHKSEELMRQTSHLAKVFALKADDRDTDHEQLVREIYRSVVTQEETLSQDQKLVIESFVKAYGKLDPDRIETIKREVDMKFSGNTITEFYELYAEDQRKLGEEIGRLKGQLELYQGMLEKGAIEKALYDQATLPLFRQLAKLEQLGQTPA